MTDFTFNSELIDKKPIQELENASVRLTKLLQMPAVQRQIAAIREWVRLSLMATDVSRTAELTSWFVRDVQALFNARSEKIVRVVTKFCPEFDLQFESEFGKSVLLPLMHSDLSADQLQKKFSLLDHERDVLVAAVQIRRDYLTVTRAVSIFLAVNKFMNARFVVGDLLDKIESRENPRTLAYSEVKLARYINHSDNLFARLEVSYRKLVDNYRELLAFPLVDQHVQLVSECATAILKRCLAMRQSDQALYGKVKKLFNRKRNANAAKLHDLLVALLPFMERAHVSSADVVNLTARNSSVDRCAAFRNAARAVCHTRFISALDFAKPVGALDDYQSVARMYVVFLAANADFRQCIGGVDFVEQDSPQKVAQWLTDRLNFSRFLFHVTRMSQVVANAAPADRVFSADMIHLVREAIARVPEFRSRAIGPGALFMPAVPYAQNQAGRLICQALADDLDLQYQLMGYEGDVAMNAHQVLVWLVENRVHVEQLPAPGMECMPKRFGR